MYSKKAEIILWRMFGCGRFRRSRQLHFAQLRRVPAIKPIAIYSPTPGVVYLQACKALIVLCFVSAGLVAADNPFLGTWKLNVAKSKFSPGSGSKEATVRFEAVGDQVRRVMQDTSENGQTTKQDSTTAWDGKDHPVDQLGITVAVNKASDHAITVTVKHEGTVVDSV